MAMIDNWPQFRKDISYSAKSNLNTLQTCIPRPTSCADRNRLWIIYIHGGVWMDQRASTFDKAQDQLLNSNVAERVAGLASINYRSIENHVSPDTMNVDEPLSHADPAHSARNSDHVNDVMAAILHLQETFCFEDRYILVGHAYGAFLALQIAMQRYRGLRCDRNKITGPNAGLPIAILGVEGLYDLQTLAKSLDTLTRHQFAKGAFDLNCVEWWSLSPTSSDLNETWPNGKLIVIAHSRTDELVEWEQPELMMKSLASQGFSESGARRSKLLEIQGKHDQIWMEGHEIARAIEWTIEELFAAH